MKILLPLTLASALLVSACSNSPQNKVDTQTHNYQCQSGEMITASYPTTDSAEVQYKDNQYDMEIAVSASGARYVGGGFEWWTKGSGAGSEGSLFEHLADGSSGDVIEECTQS